MKSTVQGDPSTFEIPEGKLKEALKRIVEQRARKIVDEIRIMMRSPKTGKIYRKPGGGTYQSSAPGEAPAIRTGTLMGAIRIRKRNEGLRADVTVEVKYGPFLEYGTRHIAPRPFLAPASALVKAGVSKRDAENSVDAAIKGRK